MAKSQMRSNREKKKPKKTEDKKVSGVSTATTQARPLNIGVQRPGGKK